MLAAAEGRACTREHPAPQAPDEGFRPSSRPKEEDSPTATLARPGEPVEARREAAETQIPERRSARRCVGNRVLWVVDRMF